MFARPLAVVGRALSGLALTLPVVHAQQASRQALQLPARFDAVQLVDVVLDGQPVSLALRPHSLRGPGFELRVGTGPGESLATTPLPPATLRGEIVGRPGSQVVGALRDGRLTAQVSSPDLDAVWTIRPDDSSDATGGVHAIAIEDDGPPTGMHCGVESEPHVDPHRDLPPGAGYSGTVQVCELAAEADHEYFQLHGSSVDATEDEIELLMNLVSAVYETELGIRFELPFVRVWTVDDGYTTGDNQATLDDFEDEWNANMTGVQRDVAHLFSGDTFGNVYGTANLNVVCNVANAYGFSRADYNPSMRRRVKLIAHELGHNFGSDHCPTTGAQCNIMCTLADMCAGGGLAPTFGNFATNQIQNYLTFQSCLDSGTPTTTVPALTGVSPAQIDAFQGGAITLTGVDLGQVTTLTVDGVDLDLWQGEFWLHADDTATFVLPTPTHLGPTTVTVSSFTGTSNALSFDVVENDPPVLDVISEVLPPWPLTWTWAGPVGDQATLLIAMDPTTVDQGGVQVLANTVAEIGATLPGPVGIDSYTRNIESNLEGVDLWSQVLVVDGQGQLSASAVYRTCIGWQNPCP